jgi:CRISPR-associated protein (TIGR02584 family)
MAAQLASPEDYQRRILLAVTGLSPQVVTETLYGLALKRDPAWIPTEIRIVTSRLGADNVRRTLLSEDPGWFHRLREEYHLPEIAFACDDIHIVTHGDGTPLDDIVEDRDNSAAADFITDQVRTLTADPAASLHVSIAGGRKTMGFYVGYALSLFGRAQDRLSHVLVSPPFEFLDDFYYPPLCTCMIRDRTTRRMRACTSAIFPSCGYERACQETCSMGARVFPKWLPKRRRRCRRSRCTSIRQGLGLGGTGVPTTLGVLAALALYALSVRLIEQRRVEELAVARLAPELAMGMALGTALFLVVMGLLLAMDAYTKTGPTVAPPWEPLGEEAH